MSFAWIKTHINAATIPCGVSVSLTRLAIWRVAILHLASIIPTVKVLKHKFISLVGGMERPMETHAASSVIISYSKTTRVRI